MKTDFAYYSSIRVNFSVHVKVNSGMDYEELVAAVHRNDPAVDRLSQIVRSHKLGQKLLLDEVPKEFFANKHLQIDKLPEAFVANGFIVVNETCADVLRKFDLGDNSLVETKFFQNDRLTPVSGEYCVLNFGGFKDTLLEDQSSAFGRSSIKTATGDADIDEFLRGMSSATINSPRGLIFKPPTKHEDDALVLSRTALEGPDLWHESRLSEGFFVSARLFNALKTAKCATPFRFNRCVVSGGSHDRRCIGG
jgi:hypothetical protein